MDIINSPFTNGHGLHDPIVQPLGEANLRPLPPDIGLLGESFQGGSNLVVQAEIFYLLNVALPELEKPNSSYETVLTDKSQCPEIDFQGPGRS
jgi:hypothetical protein